MEEINPALELNFIPNLDDISSLNDEQLDQRGYSLLMVAAEAGRLDAVNSLIHRGADVNFTVNNETSASLAFSKGHYDVVLTLLKANSQFPSNYNRSEASEELKNFVDLTEKLHFKIRKESLVKTPKNRKVVEEICTQNPSMRHFYDSNNNSALKTAIICGVFVIIEILLKHNIFLAPHEELNALVRQKSMTDRQKLRDVFFKFSPHLFSDTMMTLMRNCRFGPDGNRNPDYMNFVCKAFHVLLENPYTAIILKIVAATRNFVFVFDFKREWLDVVDPTSEPYTDGKCYLSGKIYIAAKNMLVPEKSTEIISVMAHELCHYANFLVFSNEAKPYREDDSFSQEIFSRISNFCEFRQDDEKLIRLVYECYPKGFFHAELAVRAPQMLIYYQDKPELLVEKNKLFHNLIGDYKCRVVPEMRKALPAIQAKFRQKRERKEHILNSLLIFLIFAFAMGICFYRTFNEWNNLEPLREKFYVDRQFYSKSTHNISFGNLMENLQSKRLFILSDVAGEGKSFTFRNLAIKLKEHFPNKWIQYLDLKKHRTTFELFKEDDFDDFNKLSEYFMHLLTHNNLKLSDYEEFYFPLLFKFGEFIFLYDGVDEISPKYFNFITNLILKVHEKTENIHLVSTRPLNEEDLERKLKVEAHRFEPLNNLMKNAILNHVVSNSVECEKLLRAKLNCSEIIDRVKKVIRTVETSETRVHFVMNPILVTMIANVAIDEDYKVKVGANFNYYDLYQNIVVKKIDNVVSKGDEIGKNVFFMKKNIRHIHEAYAITLILRDCLNRSSKELVGEIENLRLSSDPSTVSIYGMLQVNLDRSSEFSHRTIAEFFVVDYFIEKLSTDYFRVDIFLLFHMTISLDLHGSSKDPGAINRFFLNYCQNINLTANPFWKTVNEVISSQPLIKSITNNVDWRTKISLLKFYFLILNQYEVNILRKENFCFSNFSRFDYSRIIKNYKVLNESICQLFPNFTLLLKIQDCKGNTIMHAVAESYEDLFIPFFTQLKFSVNKKDLQSLLSNITNNAERNVWSILESKKNRKKYEFIKAFMVKL